MRADQVPPILAAAFAANVAAAPVWLDGRVDEIHIYSRGELAGSVFRRTSGGLAVWSDVQPEKAVQGPVEAIAAILATLGTSAARPR
jgi:hypothetical protein